MHAIPFYVVFLIPAAWVVGHALGGPWVLLPVVLIFGLVPALDAVLGHDRRDADPSEEQARARNPLYDLALFAWVPVQLTVLGLGLLRAVQGAGWAELAGLALATGILTGGGGINVAHELMHRVDPRHRALAEVLMLAVSYPWFCVEHVLGHHRRVATPEDPATSRLGESLYAFLPRTLWGGLRSAWGLERDRCARRGIRATSWRDRRTRYAVELAVLHLGVLALAGPAGWLFFLAQAGVAVLLLETINYVEHYGLMRADTGDGRFERVQPHHSWNSTHRLTGWFLFQLPRHADHHAHASRPYWKLRAWPDAPQLPFGYPTMVLVALVPPLWFRMMDARAAELAST